MSELEAIFTDINAITLYYYMTLSTGKQQRHMIKYVKSNSAPPHADLCAQVLTCCEQDKLLDHET